VLAASSNDLITTKLEQLLAAPAWVAPRHRAAKTRAGIPNRMVHILLGLAGRGASPGAEWMV
jgi:hypothetical protein